MRFLSHQFVHAGYAHLLSNQCMFLLYGVLFERVQGFMRTFLVYEIGVIGGALAHVSVWPYRPLIGCSHGVYAIYGACMAHMVFNIYHTHSLIGGCMALAVLMQIVTDIMSFFFWFNQDVGYAAHVGGFFAGLLFALAIAHKLKRETWKVIVGSLSFFVVMCCLICAGYRVESMWPPEALIEPFWSPVDQLPCCAEMLLLASESSAENVQNSYYCNGLDLAPY